MFGFGRDKTQMVKRDNALPGRQTAMALTEPHHIFNTPLNAPLAPSHEVLMVGMGCFWGAERKFWSLPGISTTAVGYSGGYTPNPTYEEVCSGLTGHNEVVRIVFEPSVLSVETLLQTFWNHHNPTQGMQQGNDIGTQYRSGIYTTSPSQLKVAQNQKSLFETTLKAAGYGPITTEITQADLFYFAESYHQQYLSKNPNGYCGLGGTGLTCPIGLST